MTTQTTFTIRGTDVFTTMANPRVGHPLSAEDSAGLHAITALSHAGLRVHYGCNPLTALAGDLLDPERFGHGVTPEVREAARQSLGRPAAESRAA